MKLVEILFFLLYSLVTIVDAQSEFIKFYGGEKYDRGISIHQTHDLGFIIAGYTSSFGNGKTDVNLIKTYPSGEIDWSRTFGGAEDDNGWSVKQTSDHGFLITGFTKSFGHDDYDVYVIKTDSAGNEIWSKTFGGEGDDRSWDLALTNDGNAMIIGETNNWGNGDKDILLIKIDNNGNKVWQKTFGGEKEDRAFSIDVTADGSIIFAGTTFSFGNGDRDAYIIKTDSMGNLLWSKTLGGEKSDVAHCVRTTLDNCYFITGYSAGFSDEGNRVFVHKLDKDGNEIWSRVLGNAGDYHTLYGEELPDETFIISGGVVLPDPIRMEACLIKVDETGNLLWEKHFAGEEFGNMNTVRSYNCSQTANGDVVITGDAFNYGSSQSKTFLIKTTSSNK